MNPLMDVDTLLGRLDDPQLRILDARFELLDPPAGRRMYREGHVPGALFVDLDEVLAAAPERHGGRHPLPDMATFAAWMGEHGIGDQHEVVVYDQGGTMFAARAWWLLRYAGHANVRVLDGGYGAYREAGGPVDPDEPHFAPATLSVRLRSEMAVDRARLRAMLYDPQVCILDVRSPERYRGETEPIDPKAGHVPSAVNRPYERTMTASGRFRSLAELREQFAITAGRSEVVSYCGSGVSAAHAILAMEVAGLAGARLYPGSWSDWCSYDDLPVALGDEEDA
ncbi:MAG: sulfurtransferase [Deinococcales bacterium]|jgi:thiosulfate/3-mercaptopyruvate sulfurtransferase